MRTLEPFLVDEADYTLSRVLSLDEQTTEVANGREQDVRVCAEIQPESGSREVAEDGGFYGFWASKGGRQSFQFVLSAAGEEATKRRPPKLHLNTRRMASRAPNLDLFGRQ